MFSDHVKFLNFLTSSFLSLNILKSITSTFTKPASWNPPQSFSSGLSDVEKLLKKLSSYFYFSLARLEPDRVGTRNALAIATARYLPPSNYCSKTARRRCNLKELFVTGPLLLRFCILSFKISFLDFTLCFAPSACLLLGHKVFCLREYDITLRNERKGLHPRL